MLVTKEFEFSAAHHLTKYHGACEKVHGHSYSLQITIEGEVKEDGMVMDFVRLKEIVQDRVLTHLDHTDLNDLFENPTTELIVKWIWEQLKSAPEFKAAEVKLHEARLWESGRSFVTYNGS